MSKRAAIYARVSYDDRDSSGQNLAGQLIMGREYCTRQGYQVIGEFPEDEKGASGAEINLPQLNKIREMAQAKLFEVLIVREVDRLSRDVVKFAIVQKELRKNGVSIEFVIGDFPDDKSGRLAKYILVSIAEYTRDDIREKTSRGKLLTVRSGFIIVGGTSPYGYRAVRNGKEHLRLEVNPDEAEVVRNIYTWFTDLLSIHEIVRKLDNIGAPKPMPTGKVRAQGWARSTVFKILRNKAYIGEWTYHYDKGSQIINVQVPSIVDRSTWEAAQRLMDRNKERNFRNPRYEYLLARRLTCGVCGRFMACEPQHKGKTYLYYVCPGEKNNRRSNCNIRINANLIDKLVWNWIIGILKDPDELQRHIDVYQNRSQNEPVEEQVEQLDELLSENKSKLEKVIDLYISGMFTKEQLQARKTEIEKHINDLGERRKQLISILEGQPVLKQSEVDALQSFAREISSKLDNATFEQKRQVVELLKVEGTITPEDGKKVLNMSCALVQNNLSVNVMSS